MVEYKVLMAAHRVGDVKAGGKAAGLRQKSGVFTATNFENTMNELIKKEGWTVAFSNSTSYLSDGVILYALLRKD